MSLQSFNERLKEFRKEGIPVEAPVPVRTALVGAYVAGTMDAIAAIREALDQLDPFMAAEFMQRYTHAAATECDRMLKERENG